MKEIIYFNDRVRALAVIHGAELLISAASNKDMGIYWMTISGTGKSSSFEVSALEIMQASDLQHLNNLADSRFNAALKELDN